MKKLVKIPVTFMLALALILGLGAVPGFAACNAAPKIEDVDYEGNGKVEVDFKNDVAYKNARVIVKDSKGNRYKSTITKKDDDELNFKIKKYQNNRTYNFWIKGVRDENCDTCKTCKGTVRIAATNAILVKEVDYDQEDNEVSFDFRTKVKWRSPVVTITDNAGTTYKTVILEKDRDDLEVCVTGLTYGKSYNYTISGVKNVKAKKFTTISGHFKAIEN